MRSCVLLAAAMLAVSAPSARAASPCAGAAMTFDAVSLSGGDVRAFEAALRDALDKVCGWWGPTFRGPFRIEVRDDRGPSMALVPAWRGERGTMLFRAGPVRQETAATVHEMIHVLAPNANRFLAEGFAVFGHQHLQGPRGYPDFGRDLHDAARSFADRADIAALDRVATPRRLRTDGLAERDAYVVAGSFVRYLVESHGMDKFRRLYAMTPLAERERDAGDPGRWQAVYGRSLAGLAGDWRKAVAR